MKENVILYLQTLTNPEYISHFFPNYHNYYIINITVLYQA